MTTPDTKMSKRLALCEVPHAEYAAILSALRQWLAQSLLDTPYGQTAAGSSATGKSLSFRALARYQDGRLAGQAPADLAQCENWASELTPHRNGEHT